MRAYTKAASDALDAARIVQRIPCRLLEVVIPYQLYEPLASRLATWDAHVDETDFAQDVTLRLVTPTENTNELVDRIRDFSNARAACSLDTEELRFL